MSDLLSPMPPALGGIMPNQYKFRVKNVTANTMAAGAIAYLDLSYADGDTTSSLPGHSTSGELDTCFACVVFVSGASALQRYGQAVLLLESIAAGATGMALAVGVGPAVVGGNGVSSGSTGCPLVVHSTTNDATAANNSYHILVPAYPPALTCASDATSVFFGPAGQKIVGFLLNQSMWISSASTSLAPQVWFCGLGAGFGKNGI